jgi:hypothetical protein
MEVVQGIKNNRVKSKTLSLEIRARKALLYKLGNGKRFDMLERHNNWLKFTWQEGQGVL